MDHGHIDISANNSNHCTNVDVHAGGNYESSNHVELNGHHDNCGNHNNNSYVVSAHQDYGNGISTNESINHNNNNTNINVNIAKNDGYGNHVEFNGQHDNHNNNSYGVTAHQDHGNGWSTNESINHNSNGDTSGSVQFNYKY
jgi:hypothetical protein